MERSVAFYATLGFELLAGPIGPEPVAILRHPAGIEINLVINAHPECTTNVLMDVPEKHPGYTHLALSVADVDHAARVLDAAGISLSGRMRFPFGGQALFVRDPDGNTVELNDLAEEAWDPSA
ncbi:MAG: VOC family protein [Deltaproteobacteria bacterium]|nr:MAG: VOC family protein [Deltaproteobacteria bacterium]